MNVSSNAKMTTSAAAAAEATLKACTIFDQAFALLILDVVRPN